MRANEFINEDKKRMSKSAKSSLPGVITTPDANLNAGDAYKQYRFGLALAGAPDYESRTASEIGGNPFITSYTDEEYEMIKFAAEQSEVGKVEQLTRRGSVELDDVNKVSPVAKPKRNKYGV